MSSVVTDVPVAARAARPASSRAPLLRRLLRRRAAAFGLVVVAAFIAMAVLAPLVAPYDPIATSFAAVRKAPSAAHWLGTDEIGRDVLSRVIFAARAIGNAPWRIALRHVLPNIVPPLLVQATLAIAAAVIAEASLSFLGLGQQPPQPSWGSMLNTAKNYIDNAPWMAIWPGLSIFLLVLSFNLVGDGLRDALDPRHA
jgi:ABC-type dipeptide/oligopeptide/nickel transport system permease subunit